MARAGQSFATFDAALNYTPDALGDYTAVTGATGGAIVASSEGKTLAGLTTATGIKIEGEESPQYRVNGGDWTTTPGEVNYGDEIEVRLTASDTGGAERVATLTVGGVTAGFSVTTAEATVTTPDPFTFTDQTGVALNTVITSNTITVSGINAAAPISIDSCTGTDCAYSINSGTWTADAGTVENGNTVQVRQTSSGSYSTTTTLTLDIGGVTDTFDVTTGAAPPPPITGACGAADGVATLTAPIAGLCTTGTAGTVTTANGQHGWTCSGSGGGTNAACAAPGADAGVGDIGGSGNATLTLVYGDGCTIDSANLVTPPAGGPADVDMPFGALDFTLTGCTGGSATLTVSYSGSVEGMDYWKYIGGGWTTMPATVSGTTATFTIVDNGDYDAGPTVGTIKDPGGVGLTSTPAPGTATPIPTLSEWAMILLSLLLAGVAFVTMRRRV